MRALRDQPAGEIILVASIVEKAKAANLAGDWGAPRDARSSPSEVFPALDRQIASMQSLRAKSKPDAGAWAPAGRRRLLRRRA